MRLLSALALLAFCVSLDARAQRGGGGHPGGFGGAGRAGSFGSGVRGGFGGVHGGFGGPGHSGFGPFAGAGGPRGTSGFPGVRVGAAPGLHTASRIYGYGSSANRPGYNHIVRVPPLYPGGRYPYRSSYGAPRGGYGYPPIVSFAYPVTPFWDFADSFTNDGWPYGGYPDAVYPDQAQNPYPEQTPYPQEQAPEPYPGQVVQPYTGETADGNQPMVYAPYPNAYGAPSGPPQVTVVTLPAPQREEDPVTLFYRDGRPPEQVRNYALTRSSLLVTGDRMREIPLSELDLPLTIRVNRAAGVDFELPTTH